MKLKIKRIVIFLILFQIITFINCNEEIEEIKYSDGIRYTNQNAYGKTEMTSKKNCDENMDNPQNCCNYGEFLDGDYCYPCVLYHKVCYRCNVKTCMYCSNYKDKENGYICDDLSTKRKRYQNKYEYVPYIVCAIVFFSAFGVGVFCRYKNLQKKKEMEDKENQIKNDNANVDNNNLDKNQNNPYAEQTNNMNYQNHQIQDNYNNNNQINNNNNNYNNNNYDNNNNNYNNQNYNNNYNNQDPGMNDQNNYNLNKNFNGEIDKNNKNNQSEFQKLKGMFENEFNKDLEKNDYCNDNNNKYRYE